MRTDAVEFHALNTASEKSPRFVVAILYDTDSIHVCSHDDIPNVPGTAILSALAEPIVNSQTLNPDTAASIIGNASFSLVDLESEFTDEVRDRLADGDGIRNRRCRFYLGYEGLDFTDFQLLGTQDVSNVTYLSGGYTIQCNDILRTLKDKIAVMQTTTLTESVTAGATVESPITINVADTTNFEMVFHGPSYTDSPDTTVGYFKLKNTVYRYTGKTSDSFTGCSPAFNTNTETITVDPAVSVEKNDKVTEVFYLELPAPKLLYALLTGILYSDAATLPDGWHLGIDPDYVRTADFTGLGDALWDPDNDAAGLVLRFIGTENQDGKRFCERELCLLMGMYMPVYSDGALGLRRMTRVPASAAPVLTLDETNSIQVGELQHDLDAVHNIFAVDWDWSGTRFLRTTAYADAASRAVHKDAPLYSLQFRGLYGGAHTDGRIFQLLDDIRDRYAAPPLRITVELFHSVNRLEVGDIVRVRYNHVRDFTGTVSGIDRSFEVQQISVNHRTGRVSVSLFGSTADPSANSPTTAEAALPDAFYTSQGTPLASAPGITIVGNVLTAATDPLVGDADINDEGAIYYHDDDLEIDSGVTLNIEGNVQLRVMGFLTNNGAINGVGGGHAGVADDGRSLFLGINGGNFNVPAGYSTIPGTPGYVGNSRGMDGVVGARTIPFPSNPGGVVQLQRAFTVLAGAATSLFNTAPRLTLNVVDDELFGLPTDLRGTGGPPGGRADHITSINPGGGYSGFMGITNRALGGTGGNGGAGLAIICRGYAAGASGVINLSGEAGGAGSTGNLGFTAYSGRGGGGGPGTLYMLLDGANLSYPDLTAGKYIARTGAVALQGNPIVTWPSQHIDELTEPVAGYRSGDVIDDADLSGAAIQIQYIPAEETPAEVPDPRPPPCTGLIATGVELGILLAITLPSLTSFDTVQIYAAATNDRSGATLIYEGRASDYRHQLPGGNTRYYWVRTVDTVEGTTRRVYSEWFPVDDDDGETATSTAGGTGPAGDSLTVEYSVNGSSSWHFPFVTGDLYMRQQLGGGGWSAAMRIVGEAGTAGSTGAAGNFIDFVFRRSATPPATPTGNTPSGWSDSPPAYDGNPLYISSAEKTAANVLIGVWSTPAVMAVDGEDGEDGLPGAQGPGLFTWTGAVNVATTPDTITKNAGATAFDAGAYSVQSYSTGCFVSARPINNTGGAVIGINTNPTVNASPNFAWYARADGTLVIRENGSSLPESYGAYSAATVLAIIHDTTTVQYFKDGVLQLTRTGQSVQRYFLDADVLTVESGFSDVRFGPSGPAGAAGAAGSNGSNAQTIRLTATDHFFTYNVAGTADPGGQSITLTASRQNIDTAVTWTTVPEGVTLGGSGDTRTISIDAFGSNTSVRIRAAVGGLFDDVTITRLQAEGAIEASMSNENVSLAADADGVVSDYSPAVGQITVFEGVTDRTTVATYALSSSPNCTAQINTDANTPIAGQPRGYYRVTAVTADYAAATFTATYGSVTVTKTFNITRVRQGRAGDGANLLDVSSWVIGTVGSQGNFICNGDASENQLVLGGAGSVPLGPTGASEPLWECRSNGDNGPNGGWDNVGDLTGEIDHAKSYRLTVPVRVNQMTGQVYLGCGYSETANLDGSPNTNPYFIGMALAALANAGMLTNKWYWLVGIIHGSGYTGSNTGIAGVYDPDSGIRIWQGTEYKNLPTATTQRHRAYHYYDTDTNVRQYFGRPRFEEINGNEQNLYELMGFRPVTPWIARGQMELSHSTIRKRGSGSAWDSDAQSIQSYPTCNLVFKPSQTNGAIMMGLSAAPAASTGFETIQYAIYLRSDATIRIYVGGSDVGIDYGPYTRASELSVTYDAASVRFYRDRVLLRTVALVGARLHMDSSFNTPNSGLYGVQFSSGSLLPQITPGELQGSSVGTSDIISMGLPIQSSTSVGQQISFTSPHPKTVRVEGCLNYDAEAVLHGYYSAVDGLAASVSTRRVDVVLTVYVDYYVNGVVVHTDGFSLRVRPSTGSAWHPSTPNHGTVQYKKTHTFWSVYSPTTPPSGNWQIGARCRVVIDTAAIDTYIASSGGHWQYQINDTVLSTTNSMGAGGSFAAHVVMNHGAMSWQQDSMQIPSAPVPGSDL